MLMRGLIDDAGTYRRSGVGVMSGDTVIHMAPPAERVPLLMSDLLNWVSSCDEHPLISSSVFHYEFEFIHPFSDGNGRIGRLWQTLILYKWNSSFESIPVESIVHAHQDEYYSALRHSTESADSAPFIEFVLRMILEALTEIRVSDQVSDQVASLIRELILLEMGSTDLMKKLTLTHRANFRKNYLVPAIRAGLIERTQSESPRSPTQKYRLTDRGKRCRQMLDSP